MKNKKTVFLIVGQTASGKDSLVDAICKQYKPAEKNMFGDIWLSQYKQVISYTTRPKRENEGDTHIFISQSDVKKYKDDMIAYTQIGEYEYFATKEQLKKCDFYIIDYDGVVYLRSKNLDDEFRFVTIYINTPDDIRRERALSKRKDNEETFHKRNEAEFCQFANMRILADFDYSISNIEFDKALQVLKHIVEVELQDENNG